MHLHGTHQHDAGGGTGRRATHGTDGREGGGPSSNGWATVAATSIFSASSRTRACVCVCGRGMYGQSINVGIMDLYVPIRVVV